MITQKPIFLIFWRFIYYILDVQVLCLHACMFLVPAEVRRRHWISWNWNNCQLGATMCMLKTKHRSSARGISAFNHRGIILQTLEVNFLRLFYAYAEMYTGLGVWVGILFMGRREYSWCAIGVQHEYICKHTHSTKACMITKCPWESWP